MLCQAQVAVVGASHHIPKRGNSSQHVFLLDSDRETHLAVLVTTAAPMFLPMRRLVPRELRGLKGTDSFSPPNPIVGRKRPPHEPRLPLRAVPHVQVWRFHLLPFLE